ncbi:hypothetical protein GE09DRAFT_1009459, partial [Coniochaeta sp. 2T2.1]
MLFTFTIAVVLSKIIRVTASIETSSSQCARVHDNTWSEHNTQCIPIVANQTLSYTDLNIHTGSQSSYHGGVHRLTCTEGLDDLALSPICIFTSTTFGSGRGIAVVTTIDVVFDIVSEIEHKLPTGDQNTTGNLNPAQSSPHIRTAPLPKRGLGVLATQQLAAGSLVSAYEPILLVNPIINNLQVRVREEVLRLAISRLPPASSAAYLALSSMFHNLSVIHQDILASNAFMIDATKSSGTHLAIYPETARLNHDCGPNTHYYFDGLAIYAHTTRDVADGEELTISYTNPLLYHKDRHEYLSSFGFTCTCQRCLEHEESDAGLNRVSELVNRLTASADRREIVTMAQELMALLEEEGLDGYLDVPYGYAALAYSDLGDRDSARHYAQLAREKTMVRYGPGHPDL